MSDISTDDEDETASEHWSDDGGNSSDESRRARARRGRWADATGEHWQGYAPTVETQARRDAEIARAATASSSDRPSPANDAPAFGRPVTSSSATETNEESAHS